MEATLHQMPIQVDGIINHVNSDNNLYSEEQKKTIEEISIAAAELFVVGEVYPTPLSLREKARRFATKHGFVITTEGSKLCCSRSAEPNGAKKKRAKKEPTPINKRRKHNSTRCGCNFAIKYAPVNRGVKEDKQIKITACDLMHSNGCFPCNSQLAVEKRKSGVVVASLHEARIKAIITVIRTETRVPVATLREMIRPLYPPGTALDAQLIFNLRLKIKRMIKQGLVDDINSVSITEEQERELLSPVVDESPAFLTEVFVQFQELLKEALLDKNDLIQMKDYLDSLVAADPTFSYRMSHADDGTTTGFVWQTGIMRRDFELHGSTLFIDRLGRSMNTKGWPYITTAMLDGYKRLCLGAEALTVEESIEAYVWVIQMILEMSPGRDSSGIKVIFADGIVMGETLLEKIGISDTCKLVLDHHHLVDESIGSWLKFFGLESWSRLREDLVLMAKTWHEEFYLGALERVRSAVQHNHRWSSYVEEKIHGKRHMFANYITKTYEGMLDRSGNAPAESNHSSMLGRMGHLVILPAELVAALLARHNDITAERNYKNSKFNLESTSKAALSSDPWEKEAHSLLASWGIDLYHKARSKMGSLSMVTLEDGSHHFQSKTNSTYGTLVLKPKQRCTCRSRVSFPGVQCAEELLRDGFLAKNWSDKWKQVTQLEPSPAASTSTVAIEEEASIAMELDDGFVSVEAEADFELSQLSLSQMSLPTQPSKVGMKDMLDMGKDLAMNVYKVKDSELQRLYLGAMIKLTEAAKGNLSMIDGMSLEETLENQLSMFTRNQPKQSMFSTEGESEEREMIRAAPKGSDRGVLRLRSANERITNGMRNSKKRVPSCSLCFLNGHRAGMRCPTVQDHKAVFISSKEAPKFAANLGNPNHMLVEKPGSQEIKSAIKDWMSDDCSIPSTACHLIVKRCYSTADDGASDQNNPVQCILLGDTGEALADHNPSYFPAYMVSAWITRNCLNPRRKKHLMSCMLGPMPSLSQPLYDYSP